MIRHTKLGALAVCALLALSLEIGGCTSLSQCKAFARLLHILTQQVLSLDCEGDDFVRDPLSFGEQQLMDPEQQEALSCGHVANFECANPDGEPELCVDLLNDRSFDQNTFRTGTIPNASGFWQGDQASSVTTMAGDTSAVRSCNGARMLQFIATSESGPSAELGSEAFQVVDLAGSSFSIRRGNAKLIGRTLFSRSHRPREDSLFAMAIYVFDGTVSDAPNLFASQSWLARSDVSVIVESRETPRWQEAYLELEVPPAADFALVEISAQENARPDISPREFTGHYADAVRLELDLCTDYGQIVYTDGNAQKVMKVAGTCVQQQPPFAGAGANAWSPGGDMIAYTCGGRSQRFCLTDVRGLNPRQLGGIVGPASNRISWSPDGQRLVVVDQNLGLAVFGAGEDPPAPQTVIDSIGVTVPDWSVNDRLAFSMLAGGDLSEEIYTVPATGGIPTRLTGPNDDRDSWPSWSPDGQRIAWEKTDFPTTNRSEIWVMNADGSDKTRLTSTDVDERAPAWSPDGEEIVFHRQGGLVENRGIWVINVTTREERQISNGSHFFPDWRAQ